MLQYLLSLEDDQIEILLAAVAEFCKVNQIALESDEGRRAITVAVNLLSSRNVGNLQEELQARQTRDLKWSKAWAVAPISLNFAAGQSVNDDRC